MFYRTVYTFIPTPLTHAECIERQSELGITDCRDGDDDYWGGAVQACHDMGSSLASQEQLTALANELYDKPISGLYGTPEYANRDNDLAIEWNFISSSGDWFDLWSSEENSKNHAYGRYFSSTDTTRNYPLRNTSYFQAVCLAE